jgi:hypothetical protein
MWPGWRRERTIEVPRHEAALSPPRWAARLEDRHITPAGTGTAPARFPAADKRSREVVEVDRCSRAAENNSRVAGRTRGQWQRAAAWARRNRQAARPVLAGLGSPVARTKRVTKERCKARRRDCAPNPTEPDERRGSLVRQSTSRRWFCEMRARVRPASRLSLRPTLERAQER